MANTILTPTAVTRKALQVLHQKLTFIGSINRSYDSSFAQTGAKIGTTLNIRLPNEYKVRSGATLSTQDTAETSVPLVVSTQKGVDLNFTSVDLTMSLDNFSDRILEPAMSVLAATMEADALTMALDIPTVVNNIGSALTFSKVLSARKAMVDNLAPSDARTMLLNTQDNVDLVDSLKTMFNDQATVGKQYRDGFMGHTGGFDFAESSLMANQTTGTALAATTYTVNGANQVGSGVVVATGSTTFKKGDVVTFAGCNRVHPETKTDTGALMPFVVTADYAGGAGTLAISPAIVSDSTSGRQNVSASPTNSGAVSKVGGASAIYKPSLAYQKNAFAFATADLVMPQGLHFSAREVFDGISMRIAQQYDIVNDKFPCRIDVLYGFKTIRPQLAVRLLSN